MNNTVCDRSESERGVDLAGANFLGRIYLFFHMERKFNHSEGEGGDACAGELSARDTRAHIQWLVLTGESFRFGNYYRGIGITVDYGYYELSGKYKKVGRG